MKRAAALAFLAVLACPSFPQDSAGNDWCRVKGNLNNLLLHTLADHELDQFSWQDITKDYALLGRVDLTARTFPWMELGLSLRNMLQGGQSPGDASALPFSTTGERLDLSWTVAENDDIIWKQQFDRALVRLKAGRVELTAGKQRINWSQTFAWNPNDIFNTYSFYDVDYPERPGTDALRLQYFATPTSAFEAAVKSDAGDRLSFAALYRWNMRGYDFQVLAGRLNQSATLANPAEADWYVGAGWSGSLGNAAFRGESGLYIPADGRPIPASVFEASVGLDYTFPNSLLIQGELFFNKGASAKDYVPLLEAPMTPKRLSFSEINLLLQTSYPFTPLLTGSFAIAWFPGPEGWYALPSLEYNLPHNFGLGLYFQLFRGKYDLSPGPEYRIRYTRGGVRLAYSF